MKNVMKMFIATAVMGIFTVSAFAQGAGPGGQKGQAGGGNGQTERKAGGGGGQRRGGMNMDGEIFAKLNLTDGQKAKIKALKESTQKKMQELMKGAGGPGAGAGAGAKGGGKGEAGKGGGFAGMREKFKPIMDSYQAGIKGILTPPQFAAYEKGMKEAREKMKKQFGAGGGPGGVGAKGKGKGSTPPPTA